MWRKEGCKEGRSEIGEQGTHLSLSLQLSCNKMVVLIYNLSSSMLNEDQRMHTRRPTMLVLILICPIAKQAHSCPLSSSLTHNIMHGKLHNKNIQFFPTWLYQTFSSAQTNTSLTSKFWLTKTYISTSSEEIHHIGNTYCFNFAAKEGPTNSRILTKSTSTAISFKWHTARCRIYQFAISFWLVKSMNIVVTNIIPNLLCS